MPRTVAQLIYDYFAPVQPEDCRLESLALLTRVLAVTGPVIHEGQIVSVDESGVTFDLGRAIDEHATEDRGGKVFINVNRIPPDDQLASAWGLPAAGALPIPALPPEQQSEV